MAHNYFREGVFQPPEGHEEDIKHMRNWLKGKPHLPTVSDEHLYVFLDCCGYQITKAKETLENYYTLRTNSPQFFSTRDATSSDIKSMLDICHIVSLNWTTEEGYRVVLCRLHDYDTSKFDFTAIVKMILMFVDMKLAETGFCPGWVVIIDTKGVTFGHLAKVNLTNLKLFITYIQECQPIALKAIHVINIVPVVDKAMLLMKPFMKSELLKTIHFHPSLKELSNHIPLSSLPEDYGGESESSAAVHDKQRLLMTEYSIWYKQEESLKVDESKRTGNKHPYLEAFQGTEGSFRKLEID